jgi:ubiquinone/menaquinone biosynthesis C-methylase UbiE
MNSDEYRKMEALEATHWYYAGKREFVRAWLARIGCPEQSHQLLDCGAGSGRFAKEMESHCQVLVLDDHEAALAMLRKRFRSEQVLSLSGEQIPLSDNSLDFITALDVLEHTPDDAAVVRGFGRLLKPGGVVVITVPASMALWSDWDEVLHHYRRYSRSQLRVLFAPDAWEIVHLNYTNVLVYPFVWAVRKWRRWFPSAGGVRSEDKIPHPWVNAFLRWQFVTWAKSRFPAPFGVSLVLVARRKVSDAKG